MDNHNGLITHLEANILECEVKWALGSITKNKASGSEGIPAELFQILKDDAVKVLHLVYLVTQFCLTLCDPMGTRFLCPWWFSRQNTWVGCHAFLQGIFPAQG